MLNIINKINEDTRSKQQKDYEESINMFIDELNKKHKEIIK